MLTLLVLMLLAAVGVACVARHAIPLAVAKRLTWGSLLALLASGAGLAFHLDGGSSPFHPWVWGWLLIGMFLAALCALPFGVLPWLAARRSERKPENVD